jgi:hypothetical protein
MSKEVQKDKGTGGNPGGGQGHDTASIHIDKQNLKTPTPTTGAALYVLGNVNAAKYDLFLEAPGKGDDLLIPNDITVQNVKDGSHYYSAQKALNPGA